MRGGALGVVCVLALLVVGFGRDVATEGTYQPVSFSLLSDFEYEVPDPLDAASSTQKDQVPAKVKALHGKLITVRGFMLPLDLDQDGVSQFMLIPTSAFDRPASSMYWASLIRGSQK